MPLTGHDRGMPVSLRGVVTVLLAGTGSDDDYVRRAFGQPLRSAGAVLVAPAPEPLDLVGGYLRALEAAAVAGPIAVGGVSLGAAVAASWAVRNPAGTVAVLAALPPWTGAPHGAPASVSARTTAAELQRAGLDAVTAAMRSSSPAWLADELSRSWAAQWPGLPEAMVQAAGYVAPDRSELGRLVAPMGVVAASDDHVHPLDVARDWVACAPHAALRTVELAEFGPDPTLLGDACLQALREAGQAYRPGPG